MMNEDENNNSLLTLILLMFLLVFFFACGPSIEEINAREKQRADSIKRVQNTQLLSIQQEAVDNGEEPPKTIKTYNNNADFYIGIYNINGCEYISFGQGHGCCAVVHAGNCSNPIHKDKKDE